MLFAKYTESSVFFATQKQSTFTKTEHISTIMIQNCCKYYKMYWRSPTPLEWHAQQCSSASSATHCIDCTLSILELTNTGTYLVDKTQFFKSFHSKKSAEDRFGVGGNNPIRIIPVAKKPFAKLDCMWLFCVYSILLKSEVAWQFVGL